MPKDLNQLKATIAFSHARTALKYGLIGLGLKRGDRVLLPEYICDAMLQPFYQLGIEIDYFAHWDDFSVDWARLQGIVNDQHKAIVMVHYFGQPQNIPQYLKFSRENGLFLIEDNAHGYGGRYNHRLLGSFGDIGISSPRKSIAIQSGSVLWMNDDFDFVKTLPIIPESKIKSLKIWASSKCSDSKLFQRLGRRARVRPKFENPRLFREPFCPDYLIDGHSYSEIVNADWTMIAAYRRRQYSAFERFAKDNNLEPVFTRVGEEASPWCFPAYVQAQEHAISWFDWGWRNNIKLFSWPALPEEILTRETSAANRWARLICFEIPKGRHKRLEQLRK